MRARPLVLAMALLLAGCGGDETTTATDSAPATEATTTATSPGTGQGAGHGGEAGGGQGGQAHVALGSPTASVEAALTSTDPAVACDDAVTAGYVRAAYGTEGGCLAAIRSGAQASSVKVGSVDVAGDRATAKAVPSGGPSDGDTLTVSLVLEGGSWKVDAIRSNAPVGP